MEKFELLELRASKEDEFENLLALAKKEERKLTEDEIKVKDSLKTEIRDINSKLDSFERKVQEKLEMEMNEALEAKIKEANERNEKLAQELKEVRGGNEAVVADLEKRFNELDEANKSLKDQVESLSERGLGGSGLGDELRKAYDNFKDIMNKRTSNQQFKINTRADIDGDTSYVAPATPTQVGALSVLGYEPLYQKLGLDIHNVSGTQLKIPHQDPIIGAKLAELASVTGDAVTLNEVTLSPKRHSVSKTYSVEALASATPEYFNKVMSELLKACDRSITKEVYAKILAGANTVVGAALTFGGFNGLMSSAEVEYEGAFFSNRATYFEAKGVKVDDGSGRFLAEYVKGDVIGEGQTWEGVKYWYSNLFDDGANQKYVAYGDPSFIALADFGSVEVIVDPYSQAAKGQVVITVNKLVDVALTNPDAFSVTPDLDPAA